MLDMIEIRAALIVAIPLWLVVYELRRLRKAIEAHCK